MSTPIHNKPQQDIGKLLQECEKYYPQIMGAPTFRHSHEIIQIQKLINTLEIIAPSVTNPEIARKMNRWTLILNAEHQSTILFASLVRTKTYAHRLPKKLINPWSRAKNGDTLLHRVINTSSNSLIIPLLERGVPLDQPNIYGRTPFMRALIQENTLATSILITYAQKNNCCLGLDCADSSGNTALHHIAKTQGHSVHVKRLGSTVIPALKTFNKQGYAPLHYALAHHTPCLKTFAVLLDILPEQLALLTGTTYNTPLHLAAQLKNPAPMALMLTYPLNNFEKRNSQNQNALEIILERIKDPEFSKNTRFLFLEYCKKRNVAPAGLLPTAIAFHWQLPQ